MKLTEIAIDDYGILRDLRLSNLSPGLNLVYGGSSTGKTTVIRFIRNVLFGFQQSDPNRGHIGVRNRDATFQLTRRAALPGQLVAQNISSETFAAPVAGADDSEFAFGVLGQLDAEIFDTFFNVHNRSAVHAVHDVSWMLQTRLRVPTGRSALVRDADHEMLIQEIESRRARYEEIHRRVESLQQERGRLLGENQQRNGSDQDRVAELDRKIRDVTDRINALNLQNTRDSIAQIDCQITELRANIAAANDIIQHAPAAPSTINSLVMLYQRLDEFDNQLRRWRRVHTDVQQQRVRLKDEMLMCNELTLESDQHPLHRSRNLLASLEQKVGQAEVYAKQYHADIGRPAMSAENLANHVEQVCGQMRDDIYALCNELGQQYKSIRNRAAALELKQLRRCYTEMTENIKRLVNRRQSLIEQICPLDPAGAEAIIRATKEFCACAQHEGYLQARRRFAGELPDQTQDRHVVKADTTVEQGRLRDLDTARRQLVDQLVADEKHASQLESELRSLNLQRDRLWGQLNYRDVERRVEQVEQEIRTFNDELQRLQSLAEQDRRFVPRPVNGLLAAASIFVKRLTLGEIEKIWLSSSDMVTGPAGAGVEVGDRRDNTFSFETLSSGIQEQVILSLCLAAVQQLAREGIQATVLVDDAFVNLDPQTVDATFDLLVDLCDQGHQMIASTVDRQIYSRWQAGNLSKQIAVFELPQTSVSPGPISTPERRPDFPLEPPRTPEFLTPFTTRPSTTAGDAAIFYPMVKYPPAGQLENHDARNFETGYPPISMAPITGTAGPVVERKSTGIYEFQSAFDENTDLRNVDLVDSIHLSNLVKNGVVLIRDLLVLHPNALTDELARAGFTPQQIDRWQSQAWLMICVPGLSTSDARILVANGITEPEQLDATTGYVLQQRIQRYLANSDARHPVTRDSHYDIDRLNRWFQALDRTRSRWRHPNGCSRHNNWRRPTESTETASPAYTPGRRPAHETVVQQPTEKGRPTLHAASFRDTDPIADGRSNPHLSPPAGSDSDLKFYLNLQDSIEAAPAIGPKTAERFEKIGVSSVGDFLRQTAESMATKIRYKRITANLIRQWQHQARLVCRVPNLRGHDAQLLVACEITEAEQLAAEQPKRLHDIVNRISDTKEGLKIIRNGKKPDLKEVTDWIQWAGHTRSLQAA